MLIKQYPQLVFILLLIIYLFENVFIPSGEFFLINPGIVFNVFSICKESIFKLKLSDNLNHQG